MYWLALLAIPPVGVALGPRRVSRSRRILACALSLFIPVAGIALAIVVMRLRARATACGPAPERPAARLSSGDVARLGELPPALDRLLATDLGERLEALVALSRAGDAVAVEVLRWTVDHGPPDAVLEAALTLEEIGLRGEARLTATREALSGPVGVGADAVRLLAAADAAAAPILNRLADPAAVPALADDARRWYELALAHAPVRAIEIAERIARVELAAGRPAAALAVLMPLRGRAGDPATEERLRDLRDEAAFAARAFDVLSFTPCPLRVPTDLAACKLQTLRA